MNFSSYSIYEALKCLSYLLALERNTSSCPHSDLLSVNSETLPFCTGWACVICSGSFLTPDVWMRDSSPLPQLRLPILREDCVATHNPESCPPPSSLILVSHGHLVLVCSYLIGYLSLTDNQLNNQIKFPSPQYSLFSIIEERASTNINK